jgi:regulator of protease activity HflC (stomatin/prohibitin superfamily)
MKDSAAGITTRAVAAHSPTALVEVSNYTHQTSQFAQTTLRSVLGEVELDELLAHRDKINRRLQRSSTSTPPPGE